MNDQEAELAESLKRYVLNGAIYAVIEHARGRGMTTDEIIQMFIDEADPPSIYRAIGELYQEGFLSWCMWTDPDSKPVRMQYIFHKKGEHPTDKLRKTDV